MIELGGQRLIENREIPEMFVGMVEDSSDPQAVGCMRVRCLGIDSISRIEAPTESLPWAYPALPLNSAQGSVRTPKPGTWVYGIFGFHGNDDYQSRIV